MEFIKTSKSKGKAFPKGRLQAITNSNGKVEIFNIHKKKREEFENVRIKKVGKNSFRIEAEDEEGRKVSEFIKVV